MRQSDRDEYYGTEDRSIITYLEFGEIDVGRGGKKVWDFRVHQKAYDWFMLGRYANDIVALQRMREGLGREPLARILELYRSEVHHQEELESGLRKLIALRTAGGDKEGARFVELGHTLFGCIEALEFCQALLHTVGIEETDVDLSGVRWCGIDISDLFNRLSQVLHPRYRVWTTRDRDATTGESGVFFSKGISLLYAARSVDELFGLLEKGRSALFDYSFSRSGDFRTTIGSGKAVTYLDVGSFLSAYRGRGRKMFVLDRAGKFEEQGNLIFCDCLYGEEEVCEAFIALFGEVRERLRAEARSRPELEGFFGAGILEECSWRPVEEYIEVRMRGEVPLD